MHIGGQKSSPNIQLLTNADKRAFYIEGENNLTRKSKPLPNADKGSFGFSLGVKKDVSGHPKRLQPNLPFKP